MPPAIGPADRNGAATAESHPWFVTPDLDGYSRTHSPTRPRSRGAQRGRKGGAKVSASAATMPRQPSGYGRPPAAGLDGARPLPFQSVAPDLPGPSGTRFGRRPRSGLRRPTTSATGQASVDERRWPPGQAPVGQRCWPLAGARWPGPLSVGHALLASVGQWPGARWPALLAAGRGSLARAVVRWPRLVGQRWPVARRPLASVGRGQAPVGQRCWPLAGARWPGPLSVGHPTATASHRRRPRQ
jgi:hypothetical protein